MGFFDDIFGGFFDFNNDGETDLGESWLGYMILNECMNEEENEKKSSYVSYSRPTFSDNYNWRKDSDLDNDYGLDPYNYNSKKEYLEALEEAELIAAAGFHSPEKEFDCGGIPNYYSAEESEDDDWQLEAELDSNSDLDPYDFDTEEEYLEALEDF